MVVVARIKLESHADSEGEVVFADDVIPAVVSVSDGLVVAAAADSPHSETEFAFMGLSTEMVYGKKATDSSEIKTNDDSISLSHDSVLFDFSDRSSTPSINDFQTCDSIQECSRPNHSDHNSNDFISSVSTPASESRDTIVIDCARQEDIPRKGILKSRPTGKPVNPNRPKPVSGGRPKPVSAGRPNPISAG
nr:hypothetical protein [Tanacetum cinerariifolium]